MSTIDYKLEFESLLHKQLNKHEVSDILRICEKIDSQVRHQNELPSIYEHRVKLFHIVGYNYENLKLNLGKDYTQHTVNMLSWRLEDMKMAERAKNDFELLEIIESWIAKSSPALNVSIPKLSDKLVRSISGYWAFNKMVSDYIEQLQDHLSLLHIIKNKETLCKVKFEFPSSSVSFSSNMYLKSYVPVLSDFFLMTRVDTSCCEEELNKEISDVKTTIKRLRGFIVRSICDLVTKELGCKPNDKITSNPYNLQDADGNVFILENRVAVQIFDLLYHLGLVKDLKDSVDTLLDDDKRERIKNWLKATNDDKIDFDSIFEKVTSKWVLH